MSRDWTENIVVQVVRILLWIKVSGDVRLLVYDLDSLFVAAPTVDFESQIRVLLVDPTVNGRADVELDPLAALPNVSHIDGHRVQENSRTRPGQLINMNLQLVVAVVRSPQVVVMVAMVLVIRVSDEHQPEKRFIHSSGELIVRGQWEAHEHQILMARAASTAVQSRRGV